MLSIYPNPSAGVISVNYAGDYSLRIFNLLGEVVYLNEVRGSNESLTIDLSNLKNGIYMVSVTSDEGLMMQRLEIQKK